MPSRWSQDFLDLLTALNAAEARYLLVGGHAVGLFGRPRATKDFDVWLEASSDNAARVMQALRDFGAPLGDLTEKDLESGGHGLINKRAAGRPQDLADVDVLERQAARKPGK